MIETITAVNQAVNQFIWGVPAMVCIIGVGLLLSVRTGFLQIRKFPYAIKITIGRMFRKKDASDADKGHFPPGHRETSAFSKSYHMNLCLRPQKQHAEFCQSKSMYIIHHGICTCQG